MVECEEEGGGSQDRLTDVEVRGFTVGLPGGSGGPGVCVACVCGVLCVCVVCGVLCVCVVCCVCVWCVVCVCGVLCVCVCVCVCECVRHGRNTDFLKTLM